mgnify:CR=1 FL=1
MNRDNKAITALKFFLLIIGALIMIVPILWMISTSFKLPTELNIWPPPLMPKQFKLNNFYRVFEAAPFLRYFLNSLGMALCSTVSILFTSTLAGYIFAKFKFKGRDAIFALILGTAIIPIEIYMIPLYLQLQKLHLIDTFAGLVMPYLIMSFGIFFIRQSVIQQIPDEIIESARIEGASEWRIFIQIVSPLLGSTLAALGIFAFLEGWNAFVWPLIVANSKTLFTMELGLAMFQSAYTLDISLTSAGSLVSILPVLTVFIFLRKQILESLSITGLK